MSYYQVSALNGAIKFHPLVENTRDIVIENGEVIEVIDNKIQQSGEI